MTDPRRPMDHPDDWEGTASDPRLDAELQALRAGIEFPPTPDLAGSVRARLEAQTLEPRTSAPDEPIPIDRPRPWRYRIRRSTLLAIAAMLVLAGVVVAVTYALGGWRLSFVDQVPTEPPTATAPATTAPGASPGAPTPVSTPAPIGSRLGLGTLVPLADAAGKVDFTALPPPTLPELGAPDAVYVDTVPTGGMVSYVYAPRPGYPDTSPGSGVGLIVTQFRGDLAGGEYFQKLVSRETTVTRTLVNGGNAYYVSGPKHAFLYRPPDDREAAEERFRLVGDALIWELGLLTMRIEADLTLEQARAVAESIE